MCFFKKKEKGKEKEEKSKPIFPIYLNTMRIKDVIAIWKDGISSMHSVTNERIDNSKSNMYYSSKSNIEWISKSKNIIDNARHNIINTF